MILLLTTTFLPVIGVLLTIILSIPFSKGKRWLVLFLVPALTFAVDFWLLKYPGQYSLGMMKVYPSLMLFFLYVFLLFYYPVLAVFGIIVWIMKSRKKTS